MTTTAGHSFYIRPIGSFYNQVNDTGSWEPLVIITLSLNFHSKLYVCCRHGDNLRTLFWAEIFDPDFPQMMLMIELLRCMPPTSVSCETTFSHMKLIKTSRRTEVEKFDPHTSVDQVAGMYQILSNIDNSFLKLYVISKIIIVLKFTWYTCIVYLAWTQYRQTVHETYFILTNFIRLFQYYFLCCLSDLHICKSSSTKCNVFIFFPVNGC